jgi:hypothetical protein
MEIQLISSLTPEDEARVAAAMVTVMTCLLDQFSIAYSLRVETGGRVLQRANPGAPPPTDPVIGIAPTDSLAHVAPKPELPS